MAPGHETLGGAADDLFIEPGIPHKADDEQIKVLLVDPAARLVPPCREGCFLSGIDRLT
jgi:hypothetical protein